MSAHAERLEPVHAPIVTRPFVALSALAAAGLLLVAWRFVFGVGSISALNDGYAWGMWKPFNVIVLTALGSGGYAMALLVYVLNRGRYHSLMRTAILTSALGYTTGVIALAVDIGRPWNFYQLALVWRWNLQSVLLEIAVCISTYIIFLWIEAAPPFLEFLQQRPAGRLKTFADKASPILDQAFPWVIAMAIVLPTMHQSSLGSLFLLAGPRIHPLWQTPVVPLLFLLSCYALGYACVVIASLSSSIAWKRPIDMRMLSALGRVMAYVLFALVGVRLADVVLRGVFPLALQPGLYSGLFWSEIVLLTIPAVLMTRARVRANAGSVFRLAMVTGLGAGLYRLDASLIAFMPGSHWRYFPSVPELIVTLLWPALAVLAYLAIVKKVAILPAGKPAAV
jgi:Ni/Fe-hydrogenase subunit HybB-like protein